MSKNQDTPPQQKRAKKSFEDRLDALDDNLDRLEDQKQLSEPSQRRGTAIGIAFRLVTELVAGLAVGAFLGYWIDKILGTMPVFLLIFFVLGAAAGILNVIRAAKQMQGDADDNNNTAQKS